MATEIQIYNMALVKIGEETGSATTDDTVPINLLETLFPLAVSEALGMGPEHGWRFAQWEVSDVDVDSTSITAFTTATATTTTVSSTAHSLITGDLASISGTTNYNGDFTITRVDANSFTIVQAFTADDATGTVQWTSKKHLYRYARPTCTRVTGVFNAGVELTDWIRKGSWILTGQDATDVEMDFVKHFDDLTVTDFPDHFVKVVAWKLAEHIAYSITQSFALGQQILTELERIYLPRAMNMDSHEERVNEENNNWAEAGRTQMFIR